MCLWLGITLRKNLLKAERDEMLPDETHNLLVCLSELLLLGGRRRGQLQVAVARGPIAVHVVLRRRSAAVGARLVHAWRLGGRRQPARPLARRPVPCALLPLVTGGQAGPLAATSAPRSPERRYHELVRRIGLDDDAATE